MADRKKIGYETPAEREQELFKKEIAALEKRLESTIEERLGPMRKVIDLLISSVKEVSLEVAHIKSLGHYKRIHCKHNIGGICRVWRWDEQASVPGITVGKLGDTGKFHPEPNDAWCASCHSFESSG